MSIRDVMRALIGAGRLVYFKPSPAVGTLRHLFVERSLMDKIEASIDGFTSDDERLGKLKSDFERFTSGSTIVVGDDPFAKAKNSFLARTDPVQDAVFDIRSQAPRPGLRVFSCFTEPDHLVALIVRTRPQLGGKSDKEFPQAILAAQKCWDQLFPEHKPFYSENINDHLSFNIELL